MGFSFNANHGNLVVFLTTPAAEPPRVQRSVLTEFLGGLIDAAHRGQGDRRREHREREGWMPDGGGRTYSELISGDPRWLRLISYEAKRAADAVEPVRETAEDSATVPPWMVARVLAPLANLFSQYRLYALLLARTWSGEDVPRELSAAAARLAYSGEEVLVLFPRGGGEHASQTLDALPAFSAAIAQKGCWPGILFWSQRGAAAFLREGAAIEAAQQFARSIPKQDAELERAITRLADRPARRILHLSDLHFGSKHASLNAEYVEAELADVARDAGRVVITGDLLETPSDDPASHFRRFAGSLYRASKKQVIVVPGNHDQRWHGNAVGRVGQDLLQLAQLSWSPHVVDDDLQTVFLCFNSSLTGSLARGSTGDQQSTRVAADHRNAMSTRKDLGHPISEYLTVAVIHHHPFTFETTPATWYQRALASMRLSGGEATLKMDDADAFVEWCARWRVSAILHGHKHVPRYESRVVIPEAVAPQEVTAIGCGSTLGAEGSPLSYCLLSWEPSTGRLVRQLLREPRRRTIPPRAHHGDAAGDVAA